MSAQEQADGSAAWADGDTPPSARGDAPPSARGRRLAGEGWFPLLGETLLTGLLVLAGSLAVVTAPAALAAGAAHLRRHLGGYDTSVRSFWRDWVAAVRGLWVLGVLVLGVAAVVLVNSGLTASGALPGASAVRWVTWAAAACAAVVLVRTTAAWSDDGGVWRLLSRGAARSRDDLVGSALLLAALVMCVVLVWMLTPLVVVTGGLLSLAAVAVETRRALRRPVD